MADEFEQAAELLLLAADEGVIDEEELCLLFYALEEDADPVFDETQYGRRLDIDRLSVEQCVSLFCFTQAEIRQLCILLKLPEKFTSINRTTWSSLEGLSVVLRCLSYPCRLVDLSELFGRSPTCLSIIFNQTCMFVSKTWHIHLVDLQGAYLTPAHYASYAQSIGTLCPLQTCWGFIDGTVRAMCRPSHMH